MAFIAVERLGGAHAIRIDDSGCPAGGYGRVLASD
jgi:hypothetical protein